MIIFFFFFSLIVYIFGLMSWHTVSNTPRLDWIIEWVSGVSAPGVRLSQASKASGCAAQKHQFLMQC